MLLRAAKLVLLSAALGVGVAGCGDEPVPVTKADLDGHSFVSSSVQGHELVAGTKVKLEFDAGRLAASAGCNTFAGAYTLKDGVLTQPDAIETLIGCSPAAQRQDAWLGDLLASGAEVTKLDHTLTLSTADTRITLIKQAKRSGPPPVVGTAWTLVGGSQRGGAEIVVPADAPPTLELTEDGNAKLFTGCNRGGGPATFADGFVNFGAIGITQMACEPSVSKLEQLVLKVLDGKVAAGFEGGDLSLVKDGNRLRFRAG